MFSWSRRSRPVRRLAAGKRIYAIGDVHGEAQILQRLLNTIRLDNAERGPAATSLVLLGDLVDRGPRSADILKALIGAEDDGLIVLKGNHEDLMVRACRGDQAALDLWLHVGGRATLASFGIDNDRIDRADDDELGVAIHAAVDPAVIDWLGRLPTSWSMDDYFFAHAGIVPGVPLDEQHDDRLLWGSRGFLSSRLDHGKVVVHGHYIASGTPRLGGNRIGLDTGAHERGLLTALGLEGSEQWLLQESA